MCSKIFNELIENILVILNQNVFFCKKKIMDKEHLLISDFKELQKTNIDGAFLMDFYIKLKVFATKYYKNLVSILFSGFFPQENIEQTFSFIHEHKEIFFKHQYFSLLYTSLLIAVDEKPFNISKSCVLLINEYTSVKTNSDLLAYIIPFIQIRLPDIPTFVKPLMDKLYILTNSVKREPMSYTLPTKGINYPRSIYHNVSLLSLNSKQNTSLDIQNLPFQSNQMIEQPLESFSYTITEILSGHDVNHNMKTLTNLIETYHAFPDTRICDFMQFCLKRAEQNDDLIAKQVLLLMNIYANGKEVYKFYKNWKRDDLYVHFLFSSLSLPNEAKIDLINQRIEDNPLLENVYLFKSWSTAYQGVMYLYEYIKKENNSSKIFAAVSELIRSIQFDKIGYVIAGLCSLLHKDGNHDYDTFLNNIANGTPQTATTNDTDIDIDSKLSSVMDNYNSFSSMTFNQN